MINVRKSGIVICDIDGVLNVSDNKWRLLNDTHKKHDDAIEYANTLPINLATKKLLKSIAQNHKIVFLTGRHFKHRKSTLAWLRSNLTAGHGQIITEKDLHLSMRWNDEDSSVKLKVDWVMSNYSTDEIVFAIDDRKDICEGYVNVGIPAIQIRSITKKGEE